MKHMMKFAVLAGIFFLISFAVPLTAQAEQCSPDGKICLVTDTSQAFIPPFHLQFKVTSEATYFTGTLVSQGPGDMNLWDTEINASDVSSDGPYILPVTAGIPSKSCEPATGNGCGYKYLEATFQIPVLASAVNFKTTIHRTKKQVTAVYEFDARTEVTATVELALDSFDSEDNILKNKPVTRTVGPGHRVLKVVLSRNLINRLCVSHGHCSVLAAGRVWSGQYELNRGTYDRKTLVTPRLRHLKHHQHHH